MEDKCKELLFDIFTQNINFSESVCNYVCEKCEMKKNGSCGENGCCLSNKDMFEQWWNNFYYC